MLPYDKNVVTFLSDTKATVSYSRRDFEEMEIKHKWSNAREYETVISGNKVALIGSINKTITLVDEMSSAPSPTPRSIAATSTPPSATVSRWHTSRTTSRW